VNLTLNKSNSYHNSKQCLYLPYLNTDFQIGPSLTFSQQQRAQRHQCHHYTAFGV